MLSVPGAVDSEDVSSFWASKIGGAGSVLWGCGIGHFCGGFLKDPLVRDQVEELVPFTLVGVVVLLRKILSNLHTYQSGMFSRVCRTDETSSEGGTNLARSAKGL